MGTDDSIFIYLKVEQALKVSYSPELSRHNWEIHSNGDSILFMYQPFPWKQWHSNDSWNLAYDFLSIAADHSKYIFFPTRTLKFLLILQIFDTGIYKSFITKFITIFNILLSSAALNFGLQRLISDVKKKNYKKHANFLNLSYEL